MNSQAIADRCEQADVELIRLLYVGNDGVVRGHAVEQDHVPDALESGVPLPELVQSFNALGHRVKDAQFDAVGEVRLLPDCSSFRVLDHEDRVAAVLCSLRDSESGHPWSADPRSALSRQLADLADEGLEAALALESEFHLVTDGEEPSPHGDQGVYSTASMRNGHDVILDVVDALQAQGINVHKYYPEYAAGKHEIVTKYGRGIGAVDDYVFLRETVAAVAESHGLGTTFLPYPFDGATNGCHVHLSLWDGDNRFAPSDGDRALSPMGRHFVGGILAHVPALLALTSPTVNSYARLRPQAGAAAYGCWGVENREAAVRIPTAAPGERDTATRVEYRPADNTANPYLSVLGLLAAGLDGIRNEIDPGPPLEADPANCDEATLTDRDIDRLPTTLGEALDALADDDVLRSALGEELTESYLTVKRSEWDAFTDSAATWERERLRDTF
ncbi:gamma-glutamylputrescine synthetase [Natrinema ejinorense]|uniref:Glutamine synthetase n=1 Tax=Natrinema ejinorense TaxID=373386 RepID=A0A2A5QPK4_9EURY|nr:gamma-glutamylputrescine synthetase [Natrinema ejinorense]PCR88778.1 glutamine synthetase [Natrinema ejinorense]